MAEALLAEDYDVEVGSDLDELFRSILRNDAPEAPPESGPQWPD